MRKVATFEHLEHLAIRRKSVICPAIDPWNRKSTAAGFLIHLPAIQLWKLFRAGLYVYYPRKKKLRIYRDQNIDKRFGPVFLMDREMEKKYKKAVANRGPYAGAIKGKS